MGEDSIPAPAVPQERAYPAGVLFTHGPAAPPFVQPHSSFNGGYINIIYERTSATGFYGVNSVRGE